MDISHDSAQRIVTEISSVLGADVNLMDQTAVIIASTDARRVGHHHPGAERLITERLEQLIITPDTVLPGVRPGLNLPVWLDADIVGVLGITGDPATFTTPAHVLQKMTEILLRETRVREASERMERSSTRFLQTWLSDPREVTQELTEQGRFFNVNVHERHMVAVASVVSTEPFPDTPMSAFQTEVDRLSKHLSREATARGAFTGTLGSRVYMLFPPTPDRKIGSTGFRSPAEIASWLSSAAGQVRATSTMKLAVGVSGTGAPTPEAADQALKALGHALHSPIDVQLFDDLSLELLIAAIPDDDRRAFSERVFRGVPPSALEETQRTLQVYFESDGSLAAAAEQLFIHKNTLNRRLNRVAELTGFDPRRISDGAVLWLALHVRS